MYTIKRRHNIQKKAFLLEHVSALFHSVMQLKYKDTICPIISCMIGQYNIDISLVDLTANINILPYTIYKQFGLGELKSAPITLQFADISIRHPKDWLRTYMYRSATSILLLILQLSILHRLLMQVYISQSYLDDYF